jgi:hypothetical protein
MIGCSKASRQRTVDAIRRRIQIKRLLENNKDALFLNQCNLESEFARLAACISLVGTVNKRALRVVLRFVKDYAEVREHRRPYSAGKRLSIAADLYSCKPNPLPSEPAKRSKPKVVEMSFIVQISRGLLVVTEQSFL